MIARNEILGSWTLAKIYIKLKSQHKAERTGSNNPSSFVWGQNWFTFPYPQGQDIHGGRWVWKSLTRKSLCPILLIQEERKNFIKQSWAATLPHMGGEWCCHIWHQLFIPVGIVPIAASSVLHPSTFPPHILWLWGTSAGGETSDPLLLLCVMAQDQELALG